MLTMLMICGFAMAMYAILPGVKDATLKVSRALPASTSAVTSTSGLDTGVSTTDASQNLDPGELLLTSPALSTAQLPDTKVMIYDIIASPNSDMSSPVTVAPSVLTVTGAGAAGAAAATKRIRPASDWGRYLGMRITPSAAGTGDASGVSATLEFVA